MSSPWSLAACLGVAFACQGCTLVGLGIGAATPKYGESVPNARATTSSATVSSSTPEERDTQTTPPEKREPPRKERVGSYWLEGMLTGAAFDALTIAVIAIVAASPTPPMSISFK